MRLFYFGIILFIAVINPGYACSCVGKNSIKKQIKNTDIIFTGELISVKNIETTDTLLNTKFYHFEYTFKVKSIYKGNLNGKEIKVISGTGKGDCGFKFDFNKSYIIYAFIRNRLSNYDEKINPFLYTDSCSRTRTFDVKEERKIKRITLKTRR